MSEHDGLTPLDDLASRANNNHRRALNLANESIQYALKCGEALAQAKQQVPHGQWRRWLEENCPAVSIRQAQKYVRLAEQWPRIEAAKKHRPEEITSLNGALGLIAKPAEEANAPPGAHLDSTSADEFEREDELIARARVVLQKEDCLRHRVIVALNQIQDRRNAEVSGQSMRQIADELIPDTSEELDELIALVDGDVSGTNAEQDEQHMEMIDKGLRRAVSAGHRLKALRDSQSYRGTHATFEALIADEFYFTLEEASQSIVAAEAVLAMCGGDSELRAAISDDRPLRFRSDADHRRGRELMLATFLSPQSDDG